MSKFEAANKPVSDDALSQVSGGTSFYEKPLPCPVCGAMIPNMYFDMHIIQNHPAELTEYMNRPDEEDDKTT